MQIGGVRHGSRLGCGPWRTRKIGGKILWRESLCVHFSDDKYDRRLAGTHRFQKKKKTVSSKVRPQGTIQKRDCSKFTSYLICEICFQDRLTFPSFHHVWTWQRWQRPRKGRCQTSSQDLAWQHPRYHQARHSSSRSPRWSQTNLWSHLRGDPRCSEELPGGSDSRRCHLHGACQAQDGHSHGRGLRSQETRSHSLRIRLLDFNLPLYWLFSKPPQTSKTVAVPFCLCLSTSLFKICELTRARLPSSAKPAPDRHDTGSRSTLYCQQKRQAGLGKPKVLKEMSLWFKQLASVHVFFIKVFIKVASNNVTYSFLFEKVLRYFCKLATVLSGAEERGVDGPSLDRSYFSRLQPISFLFFNPSSSHVG